jgi:hypothetical protein
MHKRKNWSIREGKGGNWGNPEGPGSIAINWTVVERIKGWWSSDNQRTTM